MGLCMAPVQMNPQLGFSGTLVVCTIPQAPHQASLVDCVLQVPKGLQDNCEAPNPPLHHTPSLAGVILSFSCWDFGPIGLWGTSSLYLLVTGPLAPVYWVPGSCVAVPLSGIKPLAPICWAPGPCVAALLLGARSWTPASLCSLELSPSLSSTVSSSLESSPTNCLTSLLLRQPAAAAPCLDCELPDGAAFISKEQGTPGSLLQLWTVNYPGLQILQWSWYESIVLEWNILILSFFLPLLVLKCLILLWGVYSPFFASWIWRRAQQNKLFVGSYSNTYCVSSVHLFIILASYMFIFLWWKEPHVVAVCFFLYSLFLNFFNV